MANVKCVGQVIRKSDNKIKTKFSGKNMKNVFGYHSVLTRAEELVNEYPAEQYEIRIVCNVEKEW